MTVSSHHPDYDEFREEWRLCRDAYRGEQAIKENGTRYLPMPGGFKAQSDGGVGMYSSYVARAQFPSIMPMTIAGMVGVIHRAESQIEMPDAMSAIWEKATPDGIPLEVFHRRITTELLIAGRYGLLVDVRPGEATPLIAGYVAETVINWDPDGSLIVLDETDYVRTNFTWVEQPAWRTLMLDDAGNYVQALYDYENAAGGEPINPTAAGGNALDFLPFIVANARDMRLDPESPPLIGVARSAKNIYQLSADYRWQLFMTGQETLFVINADAPDVVGAGVTVTLKGGDGLTPDAKYVGPAGTGIAAHRVAIQDERHAAVAAGAKMFESAGGGDESGEALRLRYAAETATLTTIAQTSAAALEKALRYVAIMMGLNPEAVIVKPNLQFVDTKMSPQEAQALVKVWQDGAISYETLYGNLQAGEIASAERDAEEELALIDDEDEQRRPSPIEAGIMVAQPSGEAANEETDGDAVESSA